MSENKEWASHIELVALADILGVPILVTTESNHEDQYQVWVYPNNVKTEEVILLGYSDVCCQYYSLYKACQHNTTEWLQPLLIRGHINNRHIVWIKSKENQGI